MTKSNSTQNLIGGSTSTVLCGLLGLFLISGCRAKDQELLSVSLTMPTLSKSSSGQKALAKANGLSALGVADSVLPAGMKACFVIDVQGSGIAQRPASQCAPTLGIYKGLVEEGQVLTLDIPKGDNRSFKLGVYPIPVSQACPVFNEAFLSTGAPFSNIYLAGETVKSLTKSEEVVEILFTADSTTPSLAEELGLSSCSAVAPTPTPAAANLATSIKLEKVKQPLNGLLNQNCTEFQATLLTATGTETVHTSNIDLYPSAVTVDSNSNSNSTATYYADAMSCSSYTNPGGIHIPAGSSKISFFVRDPYIGPNYPGTMTLDLVSVADIDLVDPSLVIAVRDYSSRVLILDLPTLILPGVCYPSQVLFSNYDGIAQTTSGSTTVSLSAGPNLKFYNENTCTTETTTATISGGSSAASIWLKAPALVTEAISVTLNQTSGDASDTGSRTIYLDAGSNTASALSFTKGSIANYTAACEEYAVVGVNSNGAALALSAGTLINLGTSIAGKGNFYAAADTSCVGGTISQVTVAAGDLQKTFRFKADLGGSFDLQATSSGLTGASKKIAITGPSQLAISLLPMTVAHYDCHPVKVSVQSPTGGTSSYSLALNLGFVGLSNGTLYSDIACSVAQPSPQISAYASDMTFYWKPNNTGAADIVTPVVSVSSQVAGLEAVPYGQVTIMPAPNQSIYLSSIDMGNNERLYPNFLGTGAAQFSLDLMGAGSNTGTTGLNSVYFTSGASLGSSQSTLNLRDARNVPSSAMAVNTIAVNMEFDFTTVTGANNAAKLLNALKVNGITPGALPGTFSRSSSAVYFDSTGTLTLATANEPRIDYDPAGAGCPGACPSRGLLIEDSATNILDYSANIAALTGTLWSTTGGWQRMDANLTIAGSYADPMGGTAAQTLTYNGGSFFPTSVQEDKGVWDADGTEYTVSMFVKNTSANPAQTTLLQIEDRANTSDLVANYTALAFDFSGADGLTIATGNSYMNPYVFPEAKRGYQKLKGGWYRVWMSFTVKAGMVGRNRRVTIIPVFNTSGAEAGFNGGATGNIAVWGVQLEYGNRMTSYIDCATGACTRAADSLVLTSANTWCNQNQGTFKVEWYDVGGDSAPRNLFDVDTGTTLGLSTDGLGGFDLAMDVNATTYPLASTNSQVLPGTNRVALSYSAGGDMILAHNDGYDSQALPSGTTNAWTNFYIGGDQSGGDLNGHLVRLRYWPAVLSLPAVQSMGIVNPPM